MRVVAGSARGRRLAVPPSRTRPTSDRAREALFSSLVSRIDLAGTRVLDLYAGSGAVGIEALSRGAGYARFVESDARAAAVIAANLAATGFGPTQAGVTRAPVAAVLATGPDEPFDLVFADPPYALPGDEVAAMLTALTEHGWLAPGALVVVERSAHSGPVPWPDSVTAVKDKRYGAGVLWYGRAR